MGQGFSDNYDLCFCGVVAISNGTALPGAPPNRESVDEEECIAGKFCNVMDDNAFKQPEQPRTHPERQESHSKSSAGATHSRNQGPVIAMRQKSFHSSRSSSRVSIFGAEQAHSKYCFKRCVYRQSQQPDAKVFLPFWFYTYCCQMALTISFMLFGFIASSILLVQSGSLQEVTIPYTADLLEKEFSLDVDLEGDVFLYYDLNFWANHRSYVESKDSRVIYSFLSVSVCTNADTREWARFRRGNDTRFIQMIEDAPGDALVPCGLISMSLFTDNFTFHRSTSDGWERIATDSSDITLPYDDEAFGKLKRPETGESRLYIEKSGQRIETWLTEDVLPFWQVWHRTPVSPHVRNLWAVIKGGLKRGTYKVTFLENSGIWHEWDVDQKYLILASRNSWLGNKGAVTAAGGLCLLLGILEAFALATMLIVPRLRCLPNSSPSVQPEVYHPDDSRGVQYG